MKLSIVMVKAPHFVTVSCISHTKPLSAVLIKDNHIRTINIMVQAATFFTLGIAIVVVVFCGFLCRDA
jgi:hypothetical protein